MLSILIPIYNRKVIRLVDELIDQCQKANIEFEIICLDDESSNDFRQANRIINERFCVNYVELTRNVGRACIRNRLGRLARYEWLLFLDCDISIPRKKFIRTYVSCCRTDGVYVGGVAYRKTPPANGDKLLHWKYGSSREQVPARKRNKMAAAYLHTANVLVPREVLLKNPFDEQLTSYGYEDLLLGHSLIANEIPIVHIDNPVIHLGLKKYDRFLVDQETAVRQLARFFAIDESLDTRLIQIYKILRKAGLLGPMYHFMEKRIEGFRIKLKGPSIHLYYLDLCKLYYFANELQTHKLRPGSIG